MSKLTAQSTFALILCLICSLPMHCMEQSDQKIQIKAVPSHQHQITLESNDGKRFSLKRSAAELSVVLKDKIADMSNGELLSVPLDGNALSLLINSLQKIDDLSVSQYNSAPAIAKALLPLFIKKTFFFNTVKLIDPAVIVRLLEASNKLNIESLMNSLLTIIADHIQNSKDLNELCCLINHLSSASANLQKMLIEKLKINNAGLLDKLPAACISIKKFKFIDRIAVSHDGKYALLTCFSDNTVCLWDLKQDMIIKRFGVKNVTAASFSPDDKFALFGTSDGPCLLLDLEKFSLIHTLTDHTMTVTSVTFSNDGKYALTGSWDLTACLWQLSDGKCLHRFVSSKPVTSVAFWPCIDHYDHDYALIASSNGSVILVKIGTGYVFKRFEDCLHEENPQDPIGPAVISPDGKQVLVGSDNKVYVYNFINPAKKERYSLEKILECHSDVVTSLAVSSDSKYILTGSHDTTARFWHLETGQMISELKGHESSINSVAFSRDGKYALTAAADDTRLWLLSVVDNLALPDLVLLVKLSQLPYETLKNAYFKRVFDALPTEIRQKHHNTLHDRLQKTYRVQAMTFLATYKKQLTVGIGMAIFGGYMLSRLMKQALGTIKYQSE